MDGWSDEGCREAGSQKLWRIKDKDRDGWRRLLKSAKILHGLQRQGVSEVCKAELNSL
jgi:hypothetical protein